VFAATVNPTVPFPVPLAPLVIVIHVAVVAAVHAHPDGVVTATLVAGPPAAPTVCDVGLSDAGHEPDCVTVCVWPAIVIVPVRLVESGLAATLNATVPLPVPLAPLVIVIHGVVVDAVHAQPDGAVTATGAPDPALAGSVCDAGLIEIEHAPACVTVCVWPAIVIVPVRLVVFGFDATSKPTVPLPDPVAPLVMVIHGVDVLAVQAQPLATVTPTVADPAPAPTDWLAGLSDAAHEPACVTENA
jgi:hypothetical protein